MGPLDITECVAIATQIASGLAAAHDVGIVHRDVKPANIMLTKRGDAKLVDFGIATLPHGVHVTRTGTTLGTVAYMAPEQIDGAGATERTDMWALGVVLFEMLTGRLPFNGATDVSLMNAVIDDRPLSVQRLRPDVPTAVANVVSRALRKDPASRFGSARELLAALRDLDTAGDALTHEPSTSRLRARPILLGPARHRGPRRRRCLVERGAIARGHRRATGSDTATTRVAGRRRLHGGVRRSQARHRRVPGRRRGTGAAAASIGRYSGADHSCGRSRVDSRRCSEPRLVRAG